MWGTLRHRLPNRDVYQLVEMASARGCGRSPVKDRNAAEKTSADGSSPSIPINSSINFDGEALPRKQVKVGSSPTLSTNTWRV